MAVGIAAAGCGKSGELTRTVATSGSGGEASTQRPAPPNGTGQQLTKAQAETFARRVNLRASDVPGFKASAGHVEHTSAEERRLEREMLHCAGSSGSNDALAEMGSREFQRQSRHLQSDGELERNRRPLLRERSSGTCRDPGRPRESVSDPLHRTLLHSQRFGNARVGPVSAAQGSPPAPGATGSFGWRFTTTIDIRRLGIPLYIDLLGFVYGQSNVTLMSFGLPEPVEASIEERPVPAAPPAGPDPPPLIRSEEGLAGDGAERLPRGPGL